MSIPSPLPTRPISAEQQRDVQVFDDLTALSQDAVAPQVEAGQDPTMPDDSPLDPASAVFGPES